MRKIIAIFTFALFALSINAQEKSAIGFSFGIGKNYFHNEFETDSKHFEFKNPNSILIGTQLVKIIDAKNKLVIQLNYTNKKIKLEYNTNEPNIPYNENVVIIDKFNSISFAAGFRRIISVNNFSPFVEASFVADYNINSSQAVKGNGKDDTTVPITEPIFYQSESIENIGQETFSVGAAVSTGVTFGKKKHSELSVNVNIPFTNIQNQTSGLKYNWQYQGQEYNHKIDYRGSIIYPCIKYTYYVFNK